MRIRLLLIAAASFLAAWGVTVGDPASAVETSAVSTPGRTAPASTWRWPMAGRPAVTRGFDPPPLRWQAGHRGVDLRARDGDRVVAAGQGVIGYAGLLAGRGVVTVHHPGGLETTYEPVEPTVHRGDRVAAGQLLGRVTSGHGSCGVGLVCLHWGLRRGTTYLDPLQLMRPTQVRLLPIFDRAPPKPPAPESRSRAGPTAPASVSLGLTDPGLTDPGLTDPGLTDLGLTGLGLTGLGLTGLGLTGLGLTGLGLTGLGLTGLGAGAIARRRGAGY